MLKKALFATTIVLGSLTATQHVMAQDQKEETVLERPGASGVSAVDAYSTKAFDTYDESRKITHDINFIKVEIKEVPPNKDGVTTETKITTGDGKTLTKEEALKQFAALLLRTVQQNKNITALAELQKPAAEGVKSAPMMKKPKAGKECSAAGDAQAYVVAETKKQTDLINQQMSTIKAIKNN